MSETQGPTKAVLLVNLGTPAELTVPALRSFLREFLSDERVIDVPRLIWYPILYGLILPFRPRKVLPLYERIWIKKDSGVVINGKTEGSPLTLYTESVAAKLGALVGDKHNGDIIVRYAMRYGEKNVQATLKAIHAEFPTVHELVVLPMFPQYSGTTCAPVYDEVFKFYTDVKRRCVPGLRTIRDYAEHPQYIESIGNSMLNAMKDYLKKESFAESDWKAALAKRFPDIVIFVSFHAIPVRYAAAGDDYPVRCTATAKLVKAYIEQQTGLDFTGTLLQVYQSQFGNEPWTGPSLVDAAVALPLPMDDPRKKKFYDKCPQPDLPWKQAKTAFAVAPGFAVDCVETIEEIGEEAAEYFTESGGRDFVYVPCLNDSDAQVQTLFAVLNL